MPNSFNFSFFSCSINLPIAFKDKPNLKTINLQIAQQNILGHLFLDEGLKWSDNELGMKLVVIIIKVHDKCIWFKQL